MATTTEPTTVGADDSLIRTALGANGVFCAVSGASIAAFAAPLGDWIGVPTAALLVVGVGLVPWGAMLWFFSRRDVVRKSEAWAALSGDELWVVATLILILGFPSALSSAGIRVVGVVGLVVAAFAIADIVGIRRLS